MKPLGKSYHGNFMKLHFGTWTSLKSHTFASTEEQPCVGPLHSPVLSLADLELNQKQRLPLRPILER